MMHKYFVRYQYTYYRNVSWNSEGSGNTEEINSHIISTDNELDDIYEVQKILKELHKMSDTYFDIIAMNRL
jgi:hypothetical protein